MKTAKGGRKISLPWFRQSSVQQSHAALSRQHTIDNCTARSFVGSKKLQVIFIFPWHLKNVRRLSSRHYHTKSIMKIIKFRRLENIFFLVMFTSSHPRPMFRFIHKLLIFRKWRHSSVFLLNNRAINSCEPSFFNTKFIRQRLLRKYHKRISFLCEKLSWEKQIAN